MIQAEINGDEIAVITKTTTTDAKTAVNVVYTSTRNIDDLAFPTVSGRSLDVTATGEAGIDLDNNNGALGTADFDADFLTNALLADNVIAAEQLAADAITAAKIATDAIGAAELATDAAQEIAGEVWDVDATGHQTQGTFGQAIGDSGADTDTIFGMLTDLEDGVTTLDVNVASMDASTITAAVIATDAIDADAIAADAIGASEIAADAITSSELATTAVNEIRDAILSDSTPFAGANIDAAISTRATPAQVNTEVVDVLTVDTLSELAQAAPTATPTFETGLMLLYMALRNRLDIDTSGGTDYKYVYNDAGTIITKKALTDDGSTYSEAEMVSGP